MKELSEQPILDFPVFLLVKILWLAGLIVTSVGIADTGGDHGLVSDTVLGGGVVFIIALLAWVPAEMRRIKTLKP